MCVCVCVCVRVCVCVLCNAHYMPRGITMSTVSSDDGPTEGSIGGVYCKCGDLCLTIDIGV